DFDGDGSVYVLSWESDCDGDGYGLVGQDCDDGDPHVNPGAPDPCDGVEGGDCIPGDGTSEDWFGLACDGEDSDACREGVFQCLLGVRVCDDMTINNVELCNGADDDCNGSVDDPLCPFFDVDGDGYIGGAELAWLGRAFGLCSADPATEWWGPIEYTGDGCVDGEDLVVLANLWSASCSGDELICR
ncbi:MAG: MopE-related protein, partial [Acidobacteriota bacterium]|nr:MopE-related protein [Acidobacteriota bacterium]